MFFPAAWVIVAVILFAVFAALAIAVAMATGISAYLVAKSIICKTDTYYSSMRGEDVKWRWWHNYTGIGVSAAWAMLAMMIYVLIGPYLFIIRFVRG